MHVGLHQLQQNRFRKSDNENDGDDEEEDDDGDCDDKCLCKTYHVPDTILKLCPFLFPSGYKSGSFPDFFQVIV